MFNRGVRILVRRAPLLRIPRRKRPNYVLRRLVVASFAAGMLFIFWLTSCQGNQRSSSLASWHGMLSEPRQITDLNGIRSNSAKGKIPLQIPPLVMKGGDPYIRALMRTISASESNEPYPYWVLYGGEHVHDLSDHPQQCVTIVTGPNKGRCTTAAGRYQILYKTWMEKAELYHPKRSQMLFWTAYSFDPEYQDAVVYAWLSDRQAWGVNISDLLHEGKLDRVLRMLSGTWTSLGYGKEDNSMSDALPEVYQQMLQEELQAAASESGTRP